MKKIDSEKDLSVEIAFLEGLRKRLPEDTELLKLLGDDYTRSGRWQDGLQIDRKLAGILPDDDTVFYNLACSLSLLGEIEESARALRRSLELGYDDWRWISRDPDLMNLRKTPNYEKLIAEAKLRQGTV